MKTYKVKIFQRANRPGWYGRYLKNGKYVIEKFGDTKPEAEQKKAEVYLQLNQGKLPQTPQKLPWGTIVKHYLSAKDSEGVRDTTLKDIGRSLESFRKIVGSVESTQVHQHLLELFIRKRKRQISVNSLNHELRNIKAFLRWSRKRNYLLTDVEVRQLPVPESEPTSFTENQVLRLLAAADKLNMPDMKLRIQIAMSTGLRRSDIEKISEKDIDRENKALRVSIRKTGKLRVMPLSDDLIKAIDVYLFKYVPQDWQLIFHPRKRERNYDYSFPQRKWDAIRRAAGFVDKDGHWTVNFKALRSTCLTMLAEQGIPVEIAQKIAGHRDIATTMKFYVLVRAKRLRAAADVPSNKKWFT